MQCVPCTRGTVCTRKQLRKGMIQHQVALLTACFCLMRLTLPLTLCLTPSTCLGGTVLCDAHWGLREVTQGERLCSCAQR